MKKRIKLVWRYCVCLLSVVVLHLSLAPAYGADAPKKTKIDPRDVYLDMQGLCGVEGMPYEFMTPPEKHVKTKLDPRDVYLDMDAICGSEGLPYRYLIIPAEYVKVKHDPKDLKLDLEKMTTDDPSFVKGQE